MNARQTLHPLSYVPAYIVKMNLHVCYNCSPAVENLPSMPVALGLIHSVHAQALKCMCTCTCIHTHVLTHYASIYISTHTNI